MLHWNLHGGSCLQMRHCTWRQLYLGFVQKPKVNDNKLTACYGRTMLMH